MEYKSQELASILHFGYPLPSAEQPLALPFDSTVFDAIRNERRILRELDDAALCDHGIKLWKQVCGRIAESRSGPFVLPLSGGLDSRAVLAGMAGQGDVDIQTVTYGVPGSFDFEIAPMVATAAGVSNTRMNLHDVEVDPVRVDRIALEPGRPSFFLDMYFNRLVSDRYGSGCTYLSGYLGDVLAGKNLRPAVSRSWGEARHVFASANRYSRSAWLSPPGVAPETLLPDEPFVAETLLGFDEQLDYAVRQECMMRPIVMRSDYDCIAPMLDREWVAFMLALDVRHRQDRSLFKKLFSKGFPELFRLPTTANGGLPLHAPVERVARHRRRLRRQRRWRLRMQRLMPSLAVPLGNPTWQYIDFRTALNERQDLSMLLDRGVERVQAQGLLPWLDTGQLLDEYRQGELKHSRALLVLVNLGILIGAANRHDCTQSTVVG